MTNPENKKVCLSPIINTKNLVINNYITIINDINDDKYPGQNTKNNEKSNILTVKRKTFNNKSPILDNSPTKSDKDNNFKKKFMFKNLTFKEVDSKLLEKKNKSKINRFLSQSMSDVFNIFLEKNNISNNIENQKSFPTSINQTKKATINNNTSSMENITIIKTNDVPGSCQQKEQKRTKRKTEIKEQSNMNTGKPNTKPIISLETNAHYLANSPRNRNSLSTVQSYLAYGNEQSRNIDQSHPVLKRNKAKNDRLINGIVSSRPIYDNLEFTNVEISGFTTSRSASYELRKIENQKLSTSPKILTKTFVNNTKATPSKNVTILNRRKSDAEKEKLLNTKSEICDNFSPSKYNNFKFDKWPNNSKNRDSLSESRTNLYIELKSVKHFFDPRNTRLSNYSTVNFSEEQFHEKYQDHKTFVKSVIQALGGCITFRSSLIEYHNSSKIALSEENSESKVFTSNFCKLMYDLKNGRDVSALLGNLEDHMKSISSCCNALTCFVNILTIMHNVMKMKQNVFTKSSISNKADFEFEKFQKSNNGIVFDCFFGQMEHRTTCETCSYCNTQYQLFNYLYIRNFDTQLLVTLESCIKKYFQKMKVDVGNTMICNCNYGNISISYQCQITHSPMYLFIYLDKDVFITNELRKSIFITTGQTIKIELTQGSVMYNLISIIDYDVIKGQYYCKCNYETMEWWQLNDEQIKNNSHCETQDIVYKNTVVFLFKKRN